MTVDRTAYLVSREVMALFDDERAYSSNSFISLNTPTEFRVTLERQPVDEITYTANDDGTYSVLRMSQVPQNRPPIPYTGWRTNDRHAIEIDVLLKSHWLLIGVSPVSWVSPYLGRSWDDRPEIPGVEIIGDYRRIEWNGGRSWAQEELAHGVVTPLPGLPAWLPFTTLQLIESTDYPPGPAGLVPLARWQQVSVDEGLQLSARALERRRGIRQELLRRYL